MTRVIWAPQAIQDVEAIRAHVARDSPHYAGLVTERIIAAVERLQDNPRSGRIVPELGDDSIREVIHGHYRIVYRLRNDAVEIATIFHARQYFSLASSSAMSLCHGRSFMRSATTCMRLWRLGLGQGKAGQNIGGGI